MEKNFESKEYVPEFEIKFGVGSSRKIVQERFSNGNDITLVGTKNFKLYLSHEGHALVRHAMGIELSDILLQGYVYFRNGRVEVSYYEPPPEDVKKFANKTLINFFQRGKIT
ncbi:MAG: hypothetical protein HYT93_04665 [Parcubacteria group bacterium]|nr:hypothetical protein [Parcubacteria group bacterium]